MTSNANDFSSVSSLESDAAARIHERLRRAGVFSVSLVGGPGCGKTSLIASTISRLPSETRIGVVSCDVISHRDADRLAAQGVLTVPLDTGERGKLNSLLLEQALSSLDLSQFELLLIEHVGSLVGAADTHVGQDAIVAVFSVAGGDDKAEKHPDLVRAAHLILLNKVDILGMSPFDRAAFLGDVRRINPAVDVLEVSALQGHGIDDWATWLRARAPLTSGGESSTYFG